MRQAKVIFAVIFAAALAGAVCAGFSAQAEAGASAAEVVREVAVAEGDIDPVLLQAVDQQLAKLPAAMLDRMLAEGWVVCVTERDLAVGFDAYDTVYGLCEPAQQTLFIAASEGAATSAPLHEVGHWLDVSCANASDTREFHDALSAANHVLLSILVDPFLENRAEQFAEVFVEYITHPEALQLLALTLYTYMDNVAAQATQN